MSTLRYNERILLPLFVLFGLLLRYLPFISELRESPILFYQPDNLYYVRRILTILNDFPKVPSFDYYLNYSEPVDFPSPPFYPFFLALISWILALGKPYLHIVELVTSGVTALAGSLICLPVYLLSKKIMDKKYALFSAFISVFMPLHYWYTNAIDGDHHGLECLIALFLFNYFLEFCKDTSLKNFFKFAISLLVIFLIWQGAILYAGLIVLFTFVYFLLYEKNFVIGKYIGFAMIFTAIIVFGFMTLLPPYKPSLHFGRYSFFSSLSLLCCGIFLTGFSFLFEKKRIMATINFLILVLLMFLLKDELLKGIGFLTGQEKGFVSVLEMQSVFKVGLWKGKIDEEFILRIIFFVYLIVPLISVYYFFRDKSTEVTFVIFLILSFAVLTFIQRRFSYIYAPFIGISLIFLMNRINSKRLLLAYMAFLIIVLSEWGISISKTKKYFSVFIEREIKDAYTWLSENTPKASKDPFDGTIKPEYSVFAPWHQGYFVVAYANRPVIANNALLVGGMESFIDVLKLMVTNSEQTFIQLLNKYNVKYLIISATTYERGTFDFLGFPYMEPIERIYGILDFNYGLKLDENSLDNFRLIGEFLGNNVNKRIKIYEYVKGANLRIHAGKNKEVTLLLKPKTPYRMFFFKKKSKTDDKGYVNFILPYAWVNGMVEADDYEIFVDDKKFNIGVSQDAVIEGKNFEIDITKLSKKRVYLD
ncbi:MAG: hypothetical protein N2202_05815 [Proteobacteria bacterium]|nr:hypothetical protein [Pseudomonadota bacterium]